MSRLLPPPHRAVPLRDLSGASMAIDHVGAPGAGPVAQADVAIEVHA